MDNISAAQEIVRSQLIENEFGGVSPSFFEQLPHRSVSRGSFDISPHPSDSKHLFTVRSASNTPDCSPTLRPKNAASPSHLDVFGNQIEKKALTAAAVDLDADELDLNPSPTHVIRQQIQTEYGSSWLCDLPARSTGVANALCDERKASLDSFEEHNNWDFPDGTPRGSPAQLRFASSPVHLDNFGNPVEKKPMLSAPNSASGSSIRSSVPNSANGVFGAWSAEPERDIDGVESQLIPLVPDLLLGPSAIPDVVQTQSMGVAIAEASIRVNAMTDAGDWQLVVDAQDGIKIQVPLSSLTRHGSSKCKTKLVHSFPNGEAHVSGRSILIVQKDDQVYALDARCHHQGGALWEGDIEDLPNGRTCVTCPKHGRKIAVNTGEVLGTLRAGLLDPNDNLSSLKLKNPTMPPQRTHRVSVDQGKTMATIHVMQDSDDVQEARMRCGIRMMSQDKENCIDHTENEIPDSDIHASVNCSSTNQMFASTKHQLRIPVENQYQARRQSARAAKPFTMGRPISSRTPRSNTTRTHSELYAPVSAQTRALLGPLTER